MRSIAVLIVLFTTAPLLVYGADQTGAEKTKKPATATIVLKPGTAEDEENIGNVRVTYEDGTKDLWTTKNNCSLARVSPDGTVGWTVHSEEFKPASVSYKVRTNATLVLCRGGQVTRKIESPQPFIQDWNFAEDGARLVVSAMFLHGPSHYTLYDVKTGKELATAKSSDEKIPAWAKPFHQE